LAVGFWESLDAISSQWEVSGKFTPQKEDNWVRSKLDRWHKAVKAVLAWSSPS